MLSKNLPIRIFLLALVFALTGCAPATATLNPLISQTPIPTIATQITSTATFDLLATGAGEWEGYLNHTPEPTCPPPPTPFSLTDIPPDWLFTPTPDPNIVTISVKIEGDYSQEEITSILFAKWLDHFLGENISPEMRLTSYTIDQVTAPAYSQYCAEKLGGLFIAETKVTVITFLPPPVPANRCQTTSRWFIAGGGPVSATETQMTFKFEAVIKKAKDIYTLQIIFDRPLCVP